MFNEKYKINTENEEMIPKERIVEVEKIVKEYVEVEKIVDRIEYVDKIVNKYVEIQSLGESNIGIGLEYITGMGKV